MPKFLIQMFAFALISAACGRSTPPPPSPGTDTPQSIRGTERLGWDQLAGDTVELARFRYAIYVDGSRSEIADAACGRTATSAGFPCSGRLPSMTPGAHTLELSTFVVDGELVESPRSAPIHVVVTAVTTANSDVAASSFGRKPQGTAGVETPRVETHREASAFRRKRSAVTTADGVRLHVEVVPEKLDDPVDLAFAADGQLFIAERAGRIRVFRDGRLQPSPAVDADAPLNAGEGLLTLAVDPDFDRNRFVYTVHAVRSGDNVSSFRLSRLRETNGTLGERAVLLDNITPASLPASAVLRFGPDRKLYAALDDGGDARRRRDLSSYGGKVLRLNRDGTTPPDQPGANPIFSYAYPSPRGLDWHPASRLLWIASRERNGSEILSARGGPNYDLPLGSDVAAIAFYRRELIPEFRDDLLIAARRGEYILRLRFDPADPMRVIASERLLEDAPGPVTAIAIGTDGSIYLCSGGALMRLTP